MTFKTDMATDLTTFFNANEFGESVTYTPATGAASTITICFEDENLSSQAAPTPSDTMTVLVKYTDVTAPARGDKLTINSVTWYLESITAGGRAEGIWHLLLTRSARRGRG